MPVDNAESVYEIVAAHPFGGSVTDGVEATILRCRVEEDTKALAE
jgi:hypothetical protein